VRVRGRGTSVARIAAAGSLIAVMLFVLDAGGVRTRWLGRGGGGGAPPQAVKLAVLPFANLTGDPEQEYLSDGVTQEMIAQLGRLHPQSLSVIARTSVMRYKKTDAPVDQVGRELAWTTCSRAAPAVKRTASGSPPS